jgi:hypothetical protein
VQGNHLGERNTGAPSRKSRAPKKIAASAVLIACVFAGVMSLVASRDATATTPAVAVRFQDDFESGNFSNWDSNSGGIVTQQLLVHTGLWAARATATGVAVPGPSAYKQLTLTETSPYYETWFYIVSQTTNVNLLRFRNNLGAHNALATLFVSSTGKLGLRNDVTGIPTTSTTVVSTGSWHKARVHVTINGTSSATEVWLDDSPIASLSQSGINLGTNPVGRLELGDPSTMRTFDVAFDDVQMFVDSTAPSAPPNLHTTSVATTRIDLAWGAATDDIGVTGYRIFRNGSATPIASLGATARSYSNTGLAPGTTYSYTVRAVDAAGNVSAASATATATTAKLNQTITFGALADKRYGNADFNVSATASSGLPVSFTASGSCTVSGSTVHLTGPGSCTVTASQPGNATYNAAAGVPQTFSIAKKPVALKCRVPKVVRKGLKAAKATIKRRHCRTGKVRYAYSRTRKKGIVISQSRRPGRVLPAKSKINLVVSRGRKH